MSRVTPTPSTANAPWRRLPDDAPAVTVFVAVTWLWVSFQWIVFPLYVTPVDSATWTSVFVLDTAHLEYLWTWGTHLLSHSGVPHVLITTLVILSFGRNLEPTVGSRRLCGGMLLVGVLASAAHVSVTLEFSREATALGASGVAFGLVGIAAARTPARTVSLFGVVPAPLWTVAAGVAGGSLAIALALGPAAWNVAHIAHAAGVTAGVAVGRWSTGVRT